MMGNKSIAGVAASLLLGGLLSVCLPSVAAFAQAAPDSRFADTVLLGGKIVTADAGFRIAQAVAIRDGRFIAVGIDGEIAALAGPRTQRIDLRGRTVLPGLIDTHAHMEQAGIASYTVPLSKATDVASALALIKTTAAKTRRGEWVLGGTWRPPGQLKENRYLTRLEIDGVAPDHPVYLPAGGHFATANSAAMKLAGITATTPDPPGGEIQRDPKTGEPTGLLIESAQHIVAAVIAPWPEDVRIAQLKEAMAVFNGYGLTSVVSGAVAPRDFRILQAIRARREMTLRVAAMYLPTGESNPSASLADWEKFFSQVGAASEFGDEWLSYAAIGEISLDGGMTLRTAFTRDPYPDDQAYHGLLNIAPERLNQLVAIANRYDWRVGIHAVGDAAVDKAIDAFAFASQEKSILGRRFAIIHGSLMRPDQMTRAKTLGLRVEVQNTFMWNKAATVAEYLGKATADRAVPTRAMIDLMGIENVGSGTDFSVNVLDPYVNIYVAVTRKDMNGIVYGKEQAITREEAIRLYTSSAARFTFAEDAKGSIEPGKLADLVVISDDLLTVPEDAIRSIQALTTMVGGRIVYQR
jgi:predicted amidohydrolase YtcJ